mgnify:CR=1 FL=1
MRKVITVLVITHKLKGPTNQCMIGSEQMYWEVGPCVEYQG